jgi:hypothetical protein
MDQLREKAQRVNAALRRAVDLAECAAIEPGAPLPLTGEDRLRELSALLRAGAAEKVLEMLSMSYWWWTLTADIYKSPPDSPEWLLAKAREMVVSFIHLRRMPEISEEGHARLDWLTEFLERAGVLEQILSRVEAFYWPRPVTERT